MPQLPRQGGRRVDATPIGANRVVVDAPREAFGVATPSPFGPALGMVTEIVQQEQVRSDRLAITEADNELHAIDTELRAEAVKRFQGKDAMQATAWVEAERTKRVSAIEARLNDRQRDVWRTRAERARIDLVASVESHAAQEFDRHEQREYAAGLQNRINVAIAEPAKAPAVLAEGRAMVQTFAKQRGLGTDQAAQMANEFASKLHTGVIERMLTDGQDQAATAYMQAHRTEIVGADRLAIEKKLEVATTDGTAMRAVDAAWAALGPKDASDPIAMAAMEQKIREEYADQPAVIKAARMELRSRGEAWNIEQRERIASAKAAVLGAYNTGATLAEVKRMPQYLALPGDDQLQIATYISDRSYTLSERARAQRDRQQHANLWRYQANPEAVLQMSDATIRALEPTVGPQGVATLLDWKTRIGSSTEAVRAATIDTELFKSMAFDAGLPAYEQPGKLSEDERATLGQLRNVVEAEIGRAQQAAKRALTRDEKETIMRQVLDQKVMRDTWGRDEETAAATVLPDDRGAVYVPIDKVPPQVVTEGLNWLRSIGAIGQGISDREARVKFQRRLERAYGLRLTGASAEEIQRALRGQ